MRPGQIELIEVPGKTPHLVYREDVSKNNAGGLKHRKIQPKSVIHYANADPTRCFVRLYKLYCSKCPQDRPENAFYLTPRSEPTDECWYSREPVGHNPLGLTVKRLCESAGISGYKTNHSLRVTFATRLFRSGVYKQIIMNVTGHQSIDGVRTYKRMSEQQYQEVSGILQGSNAKKANIESSGCSIEPQKESIPPVSVPAINIPPVHAVNPLTPAVNPSGGSRGGSTCSMEPLF